MKKKEGSEKKLKNLRGILGKMESVLIAFSGGTDSTFLLAVAAGTLGKKAAAATAYSETYPVPEGVEAEKTARRLGVRHFRIRTSELKDRKFCANPQERCYFCKKYLFKELKALAKSGGFLFVADGTNAGDERDFRPGNRAAKEFGIRSPLKEAGMTKEDVRRLSRKMHLPTWDKPALACLASRFPYGMEITRAELKKISAAEEFLKKRGFREVRVRHHGRSCRIELGRDDLKKMMSSAGARKAVLKKMKSLGFVYVTLDLEGYRTGSMNEVL